MALVQENNDCNFCDKVFKVKQKLNETQNTDGMNTSNVDHTDNKLECKDENLASISFGKRGRPIAHLAKEPNDLSKLKHEISDKNVSTCRFL